MSCSVIFTLNLGWSSPASVSFQWTDEQKSKPPRHSKRVSFTCLWLSAGSICGIRYQFHFLLAQHVLQMWLRFPNQQHMFSEVTKICVPLGWRTCFEGVKLKTRAKQYENCGEMSPSPTAPTRRATFLPLSTAQSWSAPQSLCQTQNLSP